MHHASYGVQRIKKFSHICPINEMNEISKTYTVLARVQGVSDVRLSGVCVLVCSPVCFQA